MRLLLVGDSIVTRQILEYLKFDFGCPDVNLIEDPRKAVARIHDVQPSMVVAECFGPASEALQWLGWCRRVNPDTPMILLVPAPDCAQFRRVCGTRDRSFVVSIPLEQIDTFELVG